jgi:hypothetical protein
MKSPGTAGTFHDSFFVDLPALADRFRRTVTADHFRGLATRGRVGIPLANDDRAIVAMMPPHTVAMVSLTHADRNAATVHIDALRRRRRSDCNTRKDEQTENRF